MKQFKTLTTLVVACACAITGCQKETSTSDNVLQQQNIATTQHPGLISDLSGRLAKLKASLPPGYDQRKIQNATVTENLNPEFQVAVLSALNAATPGSCNSNTRLDQLLAQQLADWDANVTYFAQSTGMMNFPAYDALFFDNGSRYEYFGMHGEYTHAINKTFSGLKRFWDIKGSGIVVAAMHGSMLRDRDKLIQLDIALYGESQPVAASSADLILSLLAQVPQYDNGDHPVFTFNSFSQNSFTFYPYGLVPAKIVMGDGLMDDLDSIGYGDIAPQAILAHEYGHQIQFQLGIYDNTGTVEGTEKNELMADAFSAYYLSHTKGECREWKRVRQFLQVFYNIGDCQFSNVNHHGTPTQRMYAAEWACRLANDVRRRGRVLTSQEFADLFDAELPKILLH